MVAATAKAAAMYLTDLDPLCCDEEQLFWVEDDGKQNQFPVTGDEEDQSEDDDLALLLQWEEEELAGLASKEAGARSGFLYSGYPDSDPVASAARAESVRWVVAAAGRLGFTAQTAILAVDYLDRFLSRSKDGAVGCPQQQQQQQQPWMSQLSAVACLSLAAKVEETHVPLLLDLQVEGTRFVFEARTVQRMELLVLSTLGWKMNPVTPLHFVDHFSRRMASSPAGYLPHREFQRRCHALLLCLVTDSRWVGFLPSVLAAAAMLHTLSRCEAFRSAPYSWDLENQILQLLSTNKADVDACYRWMILLTTGVDPIASSDDGNADGGNSKRKLEEKHHQLLFYPCPPSPNGVIDSVFSCDSSNDSWVTPSSSVSSSPVHPLFKKPKTIGGGAEDNATGANYRGLFV